jgi:hypothetical protein
MTDFYELLQTPEAMKVLRALATSPSQARRLLREVGITDKNGELKPPYRTPAAHGVATPEAPNCWACNDTGRVATSSNGEYIPDAPCAACNPDGVTGIGEAQRRREAEKERALTQTIDERDRYCEWADKLADAIAEHFGIEIGEHSAGFEANNPWANALEWIENAPRPAGVGVGGGGQGMEGG